MKIFLFLFLPFFVGAQSFTWESISDKNNIYPLHIEQDSQTIWLFSNDQVELLRKFLEDRELLIKEVNFYTQIDSIVDEQNGVLLSSNKALSKSIDIVARTNQRVMDKTLNYHKEGVSAFKEISSDMKSVSRFVNKSFKASERRKKFWRSAAGILVGVIIIETLIILN